MVDKTLSRILEERVGKVRPRSVSIETLEEKHASALKVYDTLTSIIKKIPKDCKWLVGKLERPTLREDKPLRDADVEFDAFQKAIKAEPNSLDTLIDLLALVSGGQKNARSRHLEYALSQIDAPNTPSKVWGCFTALMKALREAEQAEKAREVWKQFSALMAKSTEPVEVFKFMCENCTTDIPSFLGKYDPQLQGFIKDLLSSLEVQLRWREHKGSVRQQFVDLVATWMKNLKIVDATNDVSLRRETFELMSIAELIEKDPSWCHLQGVVTFYAWIGAKASLREVVQFFEAHDAKPGCARVVCGEASSLEILKRLFSETLVSVSPMVSPRS
ncbi:Hypothetical protein, putative [Bodo saltans]|uniref:Uncharacterized protein n=1 Tax=Bodo saltans TaxID=75058 RepID=A0A0S4JFJ9_BODSA|nr:Hypothetical protein, putative [Bodo saltans]|eukprot:CUG87750.1 Hypothetical protein, putative [Bodo saltans]